MVEIIWINISNQSHKDKHPQNILIGCIYRPPTASKEYWNQLETTLEGAEAEELVLLGDLNVDFLQPSSALYRSLNHTLILPLGLKNIITEPTRYAKNVKSSLDVILTNSDRVSNGTIIASDLSDHCLITAEVEFLSARAHASRSQFFGCRSTCFRRDMRKFDSKEFQSKLQSIDLNHFSCNNVDAMWEEWLQKFNAALDSVAPFKCFRVKRKSSPFMNEELLQIIQRRKAAYRKWRKSNCESDTLFEEFRKLRNQGNNIYRRLRNRYYQMACHNYKNNPRLLWSTINQLTGRQHAKKVTPITATTLSQYFGKLTSDESSSYILPEGPSTLEDMNEFQNIHSDEIAQQLATLNPFKAPGPDGVLPSMLKAFSLDLAPSLTIICNKSLRTGLVPQAFKDANVVPLLKSGKTDVLNPSSYRGVSLNVIMSKVLEKMVQKQIADHFEVKKPLHDHQFGFRKKRNTTQLLTVAVNDWLLARDNGRSTVIAFIDLCKAFDQLRHQSILLDLHSLGISGAALKWFQSYLQGRRQCVISGKSTSELRPIRRGVPQGSILGPTLFNLAVRSLPDIAAKHSSKLLMFADDKTLYVSHENLTMAAELVSKALQSVNSALEEKGLSINKMKTVSMFVEATKSRRPEDILVKLSGQPLEVVSSTRCLGIVIDDQLSWKDHVDFVCAKVGRKIGALRRAGRSLSSDAKRAYVVGVIQPDLEYGAAAYMTTLSHTERSRLERLHRRAIRSMDADIRTSHPMLHQLMQRWIIAAACIVFDCQNEPDTADCLKELFTGLSTKYNTRGKVNKRLEILQHKRKSGVNSISNRFSLLWNSLPKVVKLCPSRSGFKHSLSAYLHDPGNLYFLTDLLFGNVSAL